MLASRTLLSAVFLALARQVFAQSGVVGSATGFATGVTGGGNATPAKPSDIAELKSWLEDSTARVILLDKEYDFGSSQGIKKATGCRPSSNTCPSSGGQDAINGANWCTNSDYPAVSVTYQEAGLNPIQVKSNKSIVGVGSAGVIKGIGLRLANGVKNVIIQNVHITDLNPQYIWGGDAITLVGTDMIWIDHCKFSLIGRQMIVTGYEAAGRVTISNNEFDGQTTNSASCNGNHYWTMLFLGKDDKLTLSGNYVHHCSGRAPKVGSTGKITMHAVNNYFKSNSGHDFDISSGANVLIEGNVFEDVTTPITTDSASHGGNIFNAPSGSESTCQSYLGRACVGNSLSKCGAFADYTNKNALSGFSGVTGIVKAAAVKDVAASVLANAGVGKVGTSDAAKTESNTPKAVSSAAAAPAATSKATATKAATTKAAVTKATTTKATVATTKAAAATTAAASGSGTIAKYYQCGGANFKAAGKCVSGTTCQVINPWYSQCL